MRKLKGEILEYDGNLQLHNDVLNDMLDGIKREDLVKIYMNNNKDILFVWEEDVE